MRSLAFKNRPGNRYWWFRQTSHIPPIFALLSDGEWRTVEAWYDATDVRESPGEANIPCLNAISGILEGNGVPNIVQLGHYEGFSALMLGFMMRRMGHKRSVFSVDINEPVSEFTRHWITRAGLSDYVEIVVASSDDPDLPAQARDYFGGDVAALFIDSLHHYRYALRELALWWPALRPFGFAFLHDVSRFAATLAGDPEGGVGRAVREWAPLHDAPYLLINETVTAGRQPMPLTYIDGCGLGILQKRP